MLPFFSPSWFFAPSLYSLLSFVVVFFGPCGVCSLCGVWCLLSSSSPFQGSLFVVEPFPLFCFFCCLRVLVGPFTSSCPGSDLRFPFVSRPPVRTCPFSSLHFSCGDGGGWAVLLQKCLPNSAGSLVIARGTEWGPHCFCCSFVLWGLPGAQTGGNGQGI